MSGRWEPSNVELDAVARSLEPFEPTRERAEQGKAALLASTAGRAQLSRQSIAPWLVTGGALAAAAAVTIWFATRPNEHAQAPSIASEAPKQVITPIGAARFERVTDWADFVVRLDDGRIDVQVAALASGERFRAKTADAEAEVRGATAARFEIGADAGRIVSVVVRDGTIELRRIDEPIVILSAGQSWAPTKLVERDDLVVPAPPTVRAEPPRAKKPPRAGVAPPQAVAPAPTKPEPSIEVAPPPQPKPGEAEFRAGMTALRGGDARGAASSFATACRLAAGDALGEDACFWAGAAAKRAGDTTTARTALAVFLDKFPRSARAAEASALLGWILYDAGELDGAERLFHAAEHDRVPRVADSARRGLEAIDHRRHGAASH